MFLVHIDSMTVMIFPHFTSYMGVSKNSGTPKTSILIGFSIIFTIHFGFFPLFLETPISTRAGLSSINSINIHQPWSTCCGKVVPTSSHGSTTEPLWHLGKLLRALWASGGFSWWVKQNPFSIHIYHISYLYIDIDNRCYIYIHITLFNMRKREGW